MVGSGLIDGSFGFVPVRARSQAGVHVVMVRAVGEELRGSVEPSCYGKLHLIVSGGSKVPGDL